MSGTDSGRFTHLIALRKNNCPDDKGYLYSYFKALEELHELQLGKIKINDAKNIWNDHQIALLGSRGYETPIFRNAIGLIDFPVEID